MRGHSFDPDFIREWLCWNRNWESQRSLYCWRKKRSRSWRKRGATWPVKEITEELCGHEFSSSAISRVTGKLDEELERFARRPLEEEAAIAVSRAAFARICGLEPADGIDAEPIGLVLADVRMPDLLGLEAAITIRHAHPGAKVLFRSGHPGSEAPGDLRRKPFTPGVLLARIHDLLAQDGEGAGPWHR